MEESKLKVMVRGVLRELSSVEQSLSMVRTATDFALLQVEEITEALKEINEEKPQGCQHVRRVESGGMGEGNKFMCLDCNQEFEAEPEAGESGG